MLNREYCHEKKQKILVYICFSKIPQGRVPMCSMVYLIFRTLNVGDYLYYYPFSKSFNGNVYGKASIYIYILDARLE